MATSTICREVGFRFISVVTITAISIIATIAIIISIVLITITIINTICRSFMLFRSLGLDCWML